MVSREWTVYLIWGCHGLSLPRRDSWRENVTADQWLEVWMRESEEREWYFICSKYLWIMKRMEKEENGIVE